MFSRLIQWRGTLGYAWHRFCLRHSYWLVQSADGQSGFVSYGCNRAVTHFKGEFFETPQGVKIRRKWRWRKPTNTDFKRDARRYGLVVTTDEIAAKEERGELIKWPWLVEAVLDLPATREEYFRALPNSSKSDIRRLRRDGVTMRVSRDWKDWQSFYDEFYVPSMEGRHGDDARIYPLSNLQTIFEASERNELVEAWIDDERVGAIVCEVAGGEYFMRRLGWRQGGQTHYRRCVLSSLYWFSACRAIELGVPRVFVGGCYPYLESGSLYFKLKWGGKLSVKYSNYNHWRVAIDPAHPGCQAFFARHSLLLANHETQKFDVLSGRDADEIEQAQKQAEQLGAWMKLGEPSTVLDGPVTEPDLPCLLNA